MKHSPIGGSKADRWLNCTASVSLTDHVESPSSVYAIEGTNAHKVAENLVVGLPPGLGLPNGLANPDMIRHGLSYRNLCAGLLLEHPGEEFAELRVHAPKLHELAFATLDYVIISPATKTIVVMDYKYGQGELVSAVGNSQLMFGAFVLLSSLGNKAAGFGNFKLVIHQPRMVPSYSEVTLSFDRLYAFGLTVIEAIRKISSGDTAYQAGKWCKWCPQIANCQAYVKHFGVNETAPLPPTNDLSEAEVAHYMRNEKDIKRFYAGLASRIENTLLLMAAAEGPLASYAGYHLSRKAGNITWRDKIEAESLIDKQTFPAAYKTELRTPLQISQVYPNLVATVEENSVRTISNKIEKDETDYVEVRINNV